MVVFVSTITPLVYLLRRDHDHRDQIDQDPRHAAWYECNEHGKPEPEWTDAEEFAKTAAYSGDDPVMFRPAKHLSLYVHFYISFIPKLTKPSLKSCASKSCFGSFWKVYNAPLEISNQEEA